MTRGNKELMKSAYNRWCNSSDDNIFKAYDSPSMKKIEAWEYCEDVCKRYNGHDLRVIGHSCYKFTAGFIGEKEDKETGGVKDIFVFITDCYDRCIGLEEVK